MADFGKLLSQKSDSIVHEWVEAVRQDEQIETTQKLTYGAVVKGLINTIVEMVEPLASAKSIQLQVDCDRAPATTMTDPLRLQQIITNLLSNAIRYTEKGRIQVSCEQLSDRQWALAIQDTGIGITSED